MLSTGCISRRNPPRVRPSCRLPRSPRGLIFRRFRDPHNRQRLDADLAAGLGPSVAATLMKPSMTIHRPQTEESASAANLAHGSPRKHEDP
jgi:hypothetical protein